MKALSISGSPRKNGNTARILSEIEQGLKDQGYKTKHITLPESNIKYCQGEKSCSKTGICIHDDDVAMIVDEIYSSQLVVIASPSYWGDVTAQMKTFIDRCIPYCGNNSKKTIKTNETKGAAVAVRAGKSKAENENLVKTIEHFLGHLEIPLVSSFTVEGIDAAEDLEKRPHVLKEAYSFGKSLAANCS